MRSPKKTTETAEVPVRHYIIDKSAESIAGQQIGKAELKDGIMLTPSAALMYLSSGVISTTNPADEKSAVDAVEKKTSAQTTGSGEGGTGQTAEKQPDPVADKAKART